ncbi:MAG: BamA/TamA family outer membrane protein [Polyangiaceae bacterium]|nr:BamA/TamA family outer membrane protein [Polyangiaceae bacterium]
MDLRFVPHRFSLPRSFLSFLVSVATVLGAASWSNRARAEDPLNSSSGVKQVELTPPSGESSTEFNILPVVGGSSDIGIGAGFFAGLARIKPGYEPFLWNLQSASLFTFKLEGGGITLPYQDFSLKLTVPRLFGEPIRMEILGAYTWETTLRYNGIGNASQMRMPAGAGEDYDRYKRLHPQIDISFRVRLVDHVALRFGGRYVQNWIDIPERSRIRDDLASGDHDLVRLIGSTADHAVILGKLGLEWDNRDNEVSPHSGFYHTADVRLSPGRSTFLPFPYAEVSVIGRAYIPIWKPRITLALRAVGNVMIGDPPFYELYRYDDVNAIGGSTGLRGVAAQRFYGKVKLFGNAELRTELFDFHAFGKKMIFGVAAFFDGGRVFADTAFRPQLDGRTAGMKYGTGGGLRVQSGSSFVVRADAAWSPDADPIGLYVSAGQAF